MNMKRREITRIGMLAASLLLGVGVLLLQPIQGQVTAPPANAGGDRTVVFDYADQISRLVQNGKIDELSHLTIPTTSMQSSKLKDWTTEYLGQVQLQEKQRDKQYADAVSKAQEQLKAEHYNKAMGDVLLAYRIARDPDAFLKLDWIKDATDKVAARAADLEKQGKWLESLSLYTDLNTLYEVETRFKADAQRLNRRTRLLAVYTPKALLAMRKALADQEQDPTTAPTTGTKPAVDDATEMAAFTKWQDYSEKITIDMMHRAIQNAQENWVEVTTYEAMTRGGIESLRLFLTTPELAAEFPALADKAARDKFDKALNDALAVTDKGAMDILNVDSIVQGLIDASAASVKLPKEVVIMEFTDGAIEKLDPFTAVIWPHEVPEFEKNMNGKFGGVGIQISLEGGQLKVISPLEDTPAFKAGIEAGDLITAIDGKSTLGITVDQAVSSIMGTPGTPVTLRIKRGNAEKDYAIRRDIIKVSSVKGFERDAKDPTKWNFMLDPDSKIGYVRITGFQEDTPDELDAAITALKNQGLRGLVLDLRFNPGGLLQAAVDMSDMFLQDGVIVSTRGRSARAKASEWKAHAAVQIPVTMPMIVLVNEYSASASEIFAGAMKDLHRSLIIGHRSFGKGSVQNLLNIAASVRPDGMPDAMMKLTMAYYYLPNGENLHRRDGNKTWGVDPDIAVDLTPDQLADLLKDRRDNDIIKPTGAETAPAAASAPATASSEAPAPDTQLETAMLMMRLQLVQSR